MESNSSSKRLQAAPPISTYLSLYSLKYSFQRSSLMLRQPKEKWRDVLFAIIIAFVGLLFLKMFFERMMK